MHLLPPLNPMKDAPRDGTVIYVATQWGIYATYWNLDKDLWTVRRSPPIDVPDYDFIGWWPLPETPK